MTTGYSYNGDSGQITYNFGAIADVATAIGTFEGTMDGALQDLYNDFQRLFGAHWKGAAQEACDEAQRQWNSGATEIKAALGQVGQAVGASGEQMQATDNAIAQAMGG
jgi:WXG100 family type VII secretion target